MSEELNITVKKAQEAIKNLGITFNNKKPPVKKKKNPQKPVNKKRGCLPNGEPYPKSKRMWIRYEINRSTQKEYWAVYLPPRPKSKAVWVGCRDTEEEAIKLQNEHLKKSKFTYGELFSALPYGIRNRHLLQLNEKEVVRK